MKRSPYQFNIAMNEEQFKILRKLKENYGINITGCFKIFLEQYLKQLESKGVNLNEIRDLSNQKPK